MSIHAVRGVHGSPWHGRLASSGRLGSVCDCGMRYVQSASNIAHCGIGCYFGTSRYSHRGHNAKSFYVWMVAGKGSLK